MDEASKSAEPSKPEPARNASLLDIRAAAADPSST